MIFKNRAIWYIIAQLFFFIRKPETGFQNCFFETRNEKLDRTRGMAKIFHEI